MVTNNYKTALFHAMMHAGRTRNTNCFETLCKERRGLITPEVKEQLVYLMHLRESGLFDVKYDGNSVSVTGPNTVLYVEDSRSLIRGNTCRVTYNGVTKDQPCEYCEGLLAVYWEGELVSIVPVN